MRFLMMTPIENVGPAVKKTLLRCMPPNTPAEEGLVTIGDKKAYWLSGTYTTERLKVKIQDMRYYVRGMESTLYCSRCSY